MFSLRDHTRLIAVFMLGSISLLNSCSSAEPASSPSPTLPSRLLQASFTDTAGHPLVIADELESKKVALVFWQTWCASCRSEAPQLVAASREYPGMEIIGVVPGPDDVVDSEELERAIRELGLPYRNVRDRELDLTHALEIRGTPTIVVLGSRGQVLYRGHEVPDWDTVLQEPAR